MAVHCRILHLQDLCYVSVLSFSSAGILTAACFNGRMGFIGVVAIYGLFIVATIINKFLMGPVVALIVKQERREGDFR